MTDLLSISHPFQTIDDLSQRAGHRLASLIHRLAGKYPQLSKRCGAKRMLLALSVAWALTGIAKDGNQAAFEHIDEALSPPMRGGCVMTPQWGCVMVEGTPFFIGEDEQAVLSFLWDGFTIFIDHEGTDSVGQSFFDFADCRQSKAYRVMAEAKEVKSEERRVESEERREESDATEPTPVDAPLPSPGDASSRYLLSELVENTAALGSELEIRGLLAGFSYISRHDDFTDHLRGILIHRLVEFATRQPMVAENHFHFGKDVGQVITRGDGILKIKK